MSKSNVNKSNVIPLFSDKDEPEFGDGDDGEECSHESWAFIIEDETIYCPQCGSLFVNSKSLRIGYMIEKFGEVGYMEPLKLDNEDVYIEFIPADMIED